MDTEINGMDRKRGKAIKEISSRNDDVDSLDHNFFGLSKSISHGLPTQNN